MQGTLASRNVAIILEGPLSIQQRRRAISVCLADRPDGGKSCVDLKVSYPETDSLTYPVVVGPVLFPLEIEGWSESDDPWHPSKKL